LYFFLLSFFFLSSFFLLWFSVFAISIPQLIFFSDFSFAEFFELITLISLSLIFLGFLFVSRSTSAAGQWTLVAPSFDSYELRCMQYMNDNPL